MILIQDIIKLGLHYLVLTLTTEDRSLLLDWRSCVSFRPLPHPVECVDIGGFSRAIIILLGPSLSSHLCLEMGVACVWNRLHQFFYWQAGLVALLRHSLPLD